MNYIRTMKTIIRTTIYYLKVIPTWTILTIHNIWGILNVFYITWVNPMKGGLLPENHPFATGINPETGETIWKSNLVFASNRKRNFKETDEEILESVGNYMRGMVNKSVATKVNPFGVPDKMPPSINYIHGGVHYNGGWLIFDDVKDAIRHYSDPSFALEFLRFIYTEGREPVTILRDKNYPREDHLEFVCFLRTLFPFFSNSNGNKKRIGWGNPSPYPAVNTITGFWKNDTYKIYNLENHPDLARAPIAKKYFQKENYFGTRDHALWPEKYLANFTNDRVIARGEKGNLFFVDRRKIKKGFKFSGEALPNIIDRLQEKLSI